MRKSLLPFVFALAVSTVRAQNNDMYSIMYHDWSGYLYSVHGLMQQHDGDFILSTWVWPNLGETPLGNVFYKMSPTTLAITDSLFLDDSIPTFFFTQNPHGEGNIRTQVKYHEECDSTMLHISHFPDNDLNVNPEEDVVVPLCEGYSLGKVSCIDSRGDILLQYNKQRDIFHNDIFAARIGLDGTLKHQTLLYENESNGPGSLFVFQESPLKYYQWGYSDHYPYENLVIYVLDTLFNKNPVIINSTLSETNCEYLLVQYDTEVIPIGGDDVLVAAEYVHEGYSQNEYGVAVAKYDLRTMQLKGYISFDDYPNYYDTKCFGFKMMTDGTVYFLYKEIGYPDASFIAVKMDTNLNVEWKRFCKTDDIVIGWLQYAILCKDEQGEENGIAWVGEALKEGDDNNGFVYLYLNHDGTVGVSDGGIEVRPYCFYPNPTQDMLRMQYSPDVQPARVELFDLQGRLVRTQSKAFESIDMSQLPAGTYTLRVTLEDGKTYSDKVVKE